MDPAALGTLLIGLDAIERDQLPETNRARRHQRRHDPIRWGAAFRRLLGPGRERSDGRVARRVRYTPGSGVGL
jgi:hypothetical protein